MLIIVAYIQGWFYGGWGGRHGVALPFRALASASLPAPLPQVQKLLFKVPFSLPVACGHEKF